MNKKLEKLVIKKEEIRMENEEPFSFLIIKPNKIEKFNWKDPNYVKILLNLDIYDSKKTKPQDIMESIGESLDIINYDGFHVESEIVADNSEYFYELLYLELPKTNKKAYDKLVKDENELASLLNINGDKIYGSAVLIKTKLPLDSKKMFFEDTSKTDLYHLLYNRGNNLVVVYDDDAEEFQERRIIETIQEFSDSFFEEDKYKVKKLELGFLKHNINIWYTVSEYGVDNLCGKLVKDRIEKCIIFTYKMDEYLNDLSLNEVKKIIELSKILENFNTPLEFYEEEIDSLNRKVIKNKYRVLESVYKKHIK